MRSRVVVVVVAAGLIVLAPLPAGRAYAAGGEQLWVSRYVGTERGPDSVAKMVVSPDGSRVFVTGQSYENNFGLAAVTLAYDAATGTELWRALFHISCCGYNIPGDMVVSPDGSRLYIAASSYPTSYIGDLLLLVYDTSTGALVWKREVGDGVNQFFGVAVGMSPDGSTVFVSGDAVPHGATEDIITIAYDTTTGDQRWTRILDGVAHGDDSASDLAVSDDGARVYVCGLTEAPDGTHDWIVASYDAKTGHRGWQQQIDGPGHGEDFPSAISVRPGGEQVYVVGELATVDAETGALLALDASSGSSVWRRSIGGTAGEPGWVNAVVSSPDGNVVYATGYAPGPLSFSEATTAAYVAATGENVWGSRFAGPRSFGGVGSGLAVSPDGTSLFVAGVAYRDGGNDDYLTLAYTAATGERAWASRYNGPRGWLDEAYWVAVSPDATRVFVSGASKGINTDYDYATVAYDA